MAKTNDNNALSQLEDTLNEYFAKKAPALPQNVKEFIVKIAPYLAILSLIVTIPAILVLFGLGSLATMLAPMGGANTVSAIPSMWLGILLLIPVIVLEAMAIPGLFSRSAKAWKYMYWSQLIMVVSNLVQLNIVGAILGALIGFYFLFQVKSFYTR